MSKTKKLRASMSTELVQQDNDPHEHLMLPGKRSAAAESLASWNACTKNPGHEKFIAVGDFEQRHLPQRFRRDDIFEYIKATADLTVRLRVNTLSAKRPASGFFAADGLCVGTGFLCHFDPEPSTGSCPCSRCRISGRTQQTAWKFQIKTARHVVFDETEARSTTVDLYFDGEDSLREGRVKNLYGVEIDWASALLDQCVFTCVTHDLELGEQIKEQVEAWNKQWDSLWEESISPDIVVAVAHPHGQPKKVTVGGVEDERDVREGKRYRGNRYSYSCGTCPGSSGAPVLRMGDVWKGGLAWVYGWATHSMRGDQPGWNDGFVSFV